MDKKTKRIVELTQILQERNGASIRELAQLLNVSEMTVRRDLELLRKNDVVSLVHGAAIYNSDTDPNAPLRDYHVHSERTIHQPEKDKIGQAAAALVKPGDTIIVDIGTTTEKLARHLPMHAPITVLCFTMNALVEVQKRNVERLLMGGGEFHPQTQLFESPETIELVRRTRANKLFLSAAGVSRDFGLTCMNHYEVFIKQTCINCSLQKILMVTSYKFDRIRPSYFAPLSEIDIIVTDSGLSQDWRDTLEEMGIRLIVVDKEPKDRQPLSR